MKLVSLTQSDLNAIQNLIHTEVQTQLTETRSELLERLDQIMGELQASRDEQLILSHQVSEQENRLDNLETKRQPN